jgi:DNA polymerase
MDKRKALEKINKEIDTCSACKKDTTGKAVPGEGNPNAEIVFIGEAPGREEAKTGRPFVGRSGQLLRSLIREIGLKEKGVFITSPVKYLPLKGTPSKEQIEHGRIHLFKQLGVINPRVIVLLGKVAALAVLNQSLPVLKEHGKIIKKDNKTYFITLHPAAAIRFQKFKKIIKDDFERLREIVN